MKVKVDKRQYVLPEEKQGVRRGRQCTFPQLEQLKKMESMTLQINPRKEEFAVEYKRITNAAHNAGKRTGRQFAIRKISPHTIRCWRVA